uniref:Xyloglucan-specific endo-beta-1,4-glucanase 1 (GH12 protein XEG1)) n=1 Tax=Ganoderma boninense TaxID=34458 RepID=A0A5K1JZ05_9APHY|nr:Xyloglucan-specific endo-beta-1,4-glucanase 1 (EC (Glycoside hydrolase family 12 protein XEG1) (GH12 protein XEG1) [Ganoderma boninense]
MYAPSLTQVIFWVGHARVSWYLPADGDWQHVRNAGRALGNDILWRSF